jgi:hypothetical protein
MSGESENSILAPHRLGLHKTINIINHSASSSLLIRKIPETQGLGAITSKLRGSRIFSKFPAGLRGTVHLVDLSLLLVSVGEEPTA